MEDKKALVKAYAFPQLLIFQRVKCQPTQKLAHLSITKNDFAEFLSCQSEKIASRPNTHNFHIICVLLKKNYNCIISVVTYTIRLLYHRNQ